MRIKLGHGAMTDGFVWTSRDGTALRVKALTKRQQGAFEEQVHAFSQLFVAEVGHPLTPLETLRAFLRHFRGSLWASPVTKRIPPETIMAAPCAPLYHLLPESVRRAYGITDAPAMQPTRVTA